MHKIIMIIIDQPTKTTSTIPNVIIIKIDQKTESGGLK